MKKLILSLFLIYSFNSFSQGVIRNNSNTIEYLWGSSLERSMDKQGLSVRGNSSTKIQFVQTNKVILTVDYNTLTSPSYSTIDSVLTQVSSWIASYKVDSSMYSDTAQFAYKTIGGGSVGNADSLDGKLPSYYLSRANHTETQSISTVLHLQDSITFLNLLANSKADTSIITRFEQDSIAKNTTIATKWSKTGDNASFPNNYLGTTGSNDLRIGVNGRNDIRIDSIVNGLITIGNGDNGIFPKIEFNYNNGTSTTQGNYITLASGGTGRLVLNGSASTDLYVGGSAVFRVTTSDFRPVGDNAQDLGATSNYIRQTYTNGITSSGTAARTWQVRRNTSGAGNNLRINAGGAASGERDGNGGMFTVGTGNTTGTGFASFRVGRYSRAISTGTADNTESDAMIIPSSKLMADNTSTNLFNVACAAGTSFGLTVEYTIKTVGGAGNESHTEAGTLYIMASNDGAVTVTVTKTTSAQHKSDAGTYTATFAATTANPSVISVTADTDLNVNSVIHYNIINKDAQVINQL